MNDSAGLSSSSLQNHWVTGTHIWDMAQSGTVTVGVHNGRQQQVRVQDCGFSRSVLVPLEGRESVGGWRNANLSHLFEVRSAYQRVFPAHRTQPACHYAGQRRGEERRGEEMISYGTHTHIGCREGIMV